MLHHDPDESMIENEAQLRFAIGITLWLVGLATIDWTRDPDHEIWDLLLDQRARAKGIISAADWIRNGRWPGHQAGMFESQRWGRHVLLGEPLADSYYVPGEISYEGLLAQDEAAATGTPVKRGRPTLASGRHGRVSHVRTGITNQRLHRGMTKTRDHDPDAKPKRRPPPPGVDPAAWWRQDAPGEGEG